MLPRARVQQAIEHAVEMHHRDHGDDIGIGFMKGAELRRPVSLRRQSHFREQQAVAEFMGDDIEVEPIGLVLTGIVLLLPELHIAVARLRILPGDHRDQLEALVALLELPRHRSPEIALEDVQDPAQRPIDMHRDELAAVDRIVIEMAVRSGLDRRISFACVGRHVGMFVGHSLFDRIHHIHPIVGRTRRDRACRRREPDQLRLGEAGEEWRLREQPHLCAEIPDSTVVCDRHRRLHRSAELYAIRHCRG